MAALVSARPAQARCAPAGSSCSGRSSAICGSAGSGLVLSFGFSLLLSVIAYLDATNTELNFLEQRESVSLTLQVAIAVGALLALLVARRRRQRRARARNASRPCS